jgi:hypothetical protein
MIPKLCATTGTGGFAGGITALARSNLPASLSLHKNASLEREIRAYVEVTGLTLLGAVAIVEAVHSASGARSERSGRWVVPDPQKREIIQEDSIQQSVLNPGSLSLLK